MSKRVERRVLLTCELVERAGVRADVLLARLHEEEERGMVVRVGDDAWRLSPTTYQRYAAALRTFNEEDEWQ